MLTLIADQANFVQPHHPAIRGYHVVYRPGETNHCPGCGRSHWFIGRMTAECGFCSTAIPLIEARLQAATGGHSRNRRPFIAEAEAA